MTYHNQIEHDLILMYDSLFIHEDCDICRLCRGTEKEHRSLLSRPVTAWFVGNAFAEQETRILFVGKNARGFGDEQPYTKRYHNVYDYGRELTTKGWAYWNYTGEIIKAIYGIGYNNPELTAITNIVKCNNSEGIDTTSTCMKDHCIKELRVLNRELRIIKPTHVVFYTGWNYDSYIDYAFDEILVAGSVTETKTIGQYNAPWREGKAIVNGQRILFLRTCHPERKKKEDFVNAVVDWFNRTS